ncbi:MAG: outer membrane protein TolC [Verrucomicrobiaceae bacterium]|nr:outer membrane protein TolC [Verrucomicrobiaceae bacterium]
MNILIPLSAGALALAVTAYAEERPIAATSLFIERLVAEAVSKHPKVNAAKSRTQAASSAVNAIRLWEDPEIGLGITAASRIYREGNGDIAVGVSQRLPRRGLYEAQQRKAVAEQQAQRAEQSMTTNELGLAVAQATLELALADEVLGLQTEELRWLDSLVTTARERAKNPDASAVESLRLESEQALRTQKREAALRQRKQYAGTLNLLLGREAQAHWPTLALPQQADAGTSSALSLRARLEKQNPRLTSLRHQIAAAGAEADAAREKRKPALSVGVDTNTYSRGSFFDAMFSVKVTLPWFNSAAYKAEIARAEQLRSAARSDWEAASRELAAQLGTMLTDAENGEQLANAYRADVLPKTEKTVEAVQNAWVSSKATLLEVLESRRGLLESRQEHARAIASQHAALAAITALTGGFTTPDAK